MKTRFASDGGELIVFCSGSLTLGESTTQFRSLIRSLTEQGIRNLKLDFADISNVHSAGVGELVVGFTQVNSSGGTLKLNRLNKQVMRLLQITKLITVFNVFDEDDSRLPSIQINDGDFTTIKDAGALPLLLVVWGNPIKADLGAQDGIYNITDLDSPERGSVMLAAPFVLSDSSRSVLADDIHEFEDLINSAGTKEDDLQGSWSAIHDSS